MKTFTLALVWTFLLGGFSSLLAQKKSPYALYNKSGKKVSFKKMLKQLQKADIILFGEHHNNPIVHWLQLEVLEELSGSRAMALGLEMFERDNQRYLNQYLQSEIEHEGLDSLARLWSNYETDYKPFIDSAKSKRFPVIATNIPRKYARQVYASGFESLESLSLEEKAWIAPLPIAYDAELPGYKNMLTMFESHSGENLPKAQAIKDATMAYSILEHYDSDTLFLHLNGSYHSDNYEGILWYLKREQPQLNYATLSTVSQANIAKLAEEHLGKADFIICVVENMTQTYISE